MTVLEIFEKISGISFLTTEKKLNEWMENLEAFPKKPRLLIQSLKMLNSAKLSETELLDALSQNQKLIDKIVALAKDYGSLEANDLMESILNLGPEIVQCELEKDVASKFTSTIDSLNHESLKAKWRSNMKIAVIAKVIAKWLDYGEPELAFFAAMAKPLGKILIELKEPFAYEQILDSIAHGVKQNEAEISVLGFDSSRVNAKLFETWKMPAAMIELAKNDYKTEKVSDEFKELAQIINFADYIAKSFENKTETPSSIWNKAQDYCETLGIEMDLELWADEISILFVKTLEFEKSVFE